LACIHLFNLRLRAIGATGRRVAGAAGVSCVPGFRRKPLLFLTDKRFYVVLSGESH